MKGFADTLPSIESIRFKRNTIELHLMDGRVISAPLNRFPEIKKLTPQQRKKHHIMGGIGFDFDDSDEVYHISEFLGENNSLPAFESQMKSHLNPKTKSTTLSKRKRSSSHKRVKQRI